MQRQATDWVKILHIDDKDLHADYLKNSQVRIIRKQATQFNTGKIWIDFTKENIWMANRHMQKMLIISHWRNEN